MTIRTRRSSGNVFRDLGFGSEEAANLQVRATLMVELARLIKAKRLTQREAAKVFGVSQPRVSDLIGGKIGRFSIDALVELLGRMGRRVEVTTKPQSRVA